MSTSKYPSEIKINPNQGGKAAIERLVEAYGFKTRQSLADHLDVSKSTLANRYMRDTFPSDWIIQCALETGTSLAWLTTGQGSKGNSQKENIIELEKFSITAGNLHPDGSYIFDVAFLPANLANAMVVQDGVTTYVCERQFSNVQDGYWLVNIEDSFSIRHITRLPKSMIKVSTATSNFECDISDIEFIALIRSSTVVN